MIAWFSAQPLVFKIVLGGLGSVLLLFSLWLLWRLWFRQYLEWHNVKSLEIKERVGLKIEFIKTAAQTLGGLFFLVTIYVAWANLEVSQEKYKTDLFVQAIKQLGDEKMEVRLGGIYALERIARDSEKDHGPIMEVLTAYVRENAPWPPKKANGAKEEPAVSPKPAPGEKELETKRAPEIKPRTDIQAILTVIGRLGPAYGKNNKPQLLVLCETDLRMTNLVEAHLEGAYLRETHLEGVTLWKAHLEGAYLFRAHLEEAFFSGAHLEGAVLVAAYLKGVDLTGANLKGANLEWAKGLTKEQIDSAIIDKNTKLPDNLKPAGPDKAKPQ